MREPHGMGFTIHAKVDVLNPRFNPREGNPEVTGIPQVDYSTSQRQLTSMQAKVAYLIKTPITT